jgi:DNA-binding CsgD family transcriptional regulator
MYGAASGGPSADAPPCGRDEAEPATETLRWFELDPTPIIVAGFDRRILQVNPAGGRALEDVASVIDGRLAFCDLHAGRALESALAAIASRSADRISTILRCDDGFWRRITVMHCGDPHTDAAFVVLHGADGGDGGDEDNAALTEAFGLSPMEARILAILARGAAAKAIAAEFGISPHTVRAHLRSLYGKIKVRGLYDLVREHTRLTS